MMINNIFKFSLIIIFLFSAFSCNTDDQEMIENLTIDIPIEEKKTIEIRISKEEYDEFYSINSFGYAMSVSGSFKVLENETIEYGERVKEINISEISIKVANIPENPEARLQIVFNNTLNNLMSDYFTLKDLESGETLNLTQNDIDVIQDNILNKRDNFYQILLGFRDSISLDLEVTILGTMKVIPEE